MVLVASGIGCLVALTFEAEEDLLHPADIPRSLGDRLAPAVLELNHVCDPLPCGAFGEGVVSGVDERRLVLLVLGNLLLLLLVVARVEVVDGRLGLADDLLLAFS